MRPGSDLPADLGVVQCGGRGIGLGQDEGGSATYVEHHRTLGDRVREISAAGLVLVDLVEPEWPEDHDETWGAWSPLRGRLFPGTAVFVCRKPA